MFYGAGVFSALLLLPEHLLSAADVADFIAALLILAAAAVVYFGGGVGGTVTVGIADIFVVGTALATVSTVVDFSVAELWCLCCCTFGCSHNC